MSNCKAFTASPAAAAKQSQKAMQRIAGKPFSGTPVRPRFATAMVKVSKGKMQRGAAVQVLAVKDGAVLDRPLRVAVIGGGPAGACAAETLAKGGCETYLIERKMDNCKVSCA